MIEIEIIADNTKDVLQRIQKFIGGIIEEKWNECTLVVDNDKACGSIRFIPFDWGINLLDYNIRFSDDINLEIYASKFNPIRFIYPLSGSFIHQFEIDSDGEEIEQFQSLIFTNKTGGKNYLKLPKDVDLKINVIEITRRHFLKKRTTNISTLNKKLYEVFVDTDHENRFRHFGILNLKMADQVKKLWKIKSKGMLRILKIEAILYEILTMHIQQHNKLDQGIPLPTSLIKSELVVIRKLANGIIKNPSKDYSLGYLATESGLSQAKLQDGFKFLFKRTVTEYIRHVRLEVARDLITTTDLNISQIVYTIGFTSRSYFSKIFKEKYGITPNEFKKQHVVAVAV
ncbi:helix-turn-helix domain-containing protein [Flavisericum labens]|uniref:helix-turn-helix domain-containing protein n=1 Tax=Flavisericum labens TaxID=3377112 RepID=UPI00387B4B13